MKARTVKEGLPRNSRQRPVVFLFGRRRVELKPVTVSARQRLQGLIRALWNDQRREFWLYTTADLVADLRDWYGFKACEEEVSKAAKDVGLRKVPNERRVRRLLDRNGKVTKGSVWWIPECREYPKLPAEFKTGAGVTKCYNQQRVHVALKKLAKSSFAAPRTPLERSRSQ